MRTAGRGRRAVHHAGVPGVDVRAASPDREAARTAGGGCSPGTRDRLTAIYDNVVAVICGGVRGLEEQ